MKKIIVWAIILLSIGLRLFKFDTFPFVYSSDSTAHSWAGTTLLQGKKPAAMTLFIQDNPKLFWFSHYNYFDTVRKLDFRLVEPYLDQPPLAMPIIGALPFAFGYTDFREFPTGLVRIPSLLAATAALFLLYAVGKRFFSESVAILAVAFYGLTPYFVFAHREAFIENFLTPLYLGSILLLDSYLKQKKTLTFVALCLLAFVSGLFKTVGFILPLILCFWLLKYKNYKEVAAIAVVFALSVGVYWLYGTHIDAEQFSLLLSLQSSRGFALDSIVTILTRPLFYEPFIDGWYLLQYVLLFGVWAVGTYTHKTRFIYTTAAFIAISIFLTIGQNNNFPWYKYPLFPFLSLATAQVALRVFAKPQLFSYFMFMLFLGVNAYLLFSSQAISAADTVLRFGFILLLLPPILYALWESTLTKRVTQIAFGGIIVISLLLNIAVVLTYPQSRCETTHCMLPIKMVIPN